MKIEMVSVEMLPDGRMNAKNAASYTGLTQKTMAMKRGNGTGPRYIKRGRIFYFQKDLDEWINDGRRVRSTAQEDLGVL